MRTILIITTIFFATSANCPAQTRLVNADYADYYNWFHQQSQVEQLYSDHTTLYVFGEQTAVHQGPCRTSAVLTQLPIGHAVSNIAYDEYYIPEDEIDGYGDIWYHVKGKNDKGEAFVGYVWGADIAKGWRKANLSGNKQPEFIMLGISSKARKQPKDIKAEIRIVQNNLLLYQKTIPSLCVFEDCASSPLLRVMENQPFAGQIIIEASTMTIGCFAGIEKAYLYWNGKTLEHIHQAEYTTEKEYMSKTFVVHTNGKDTGTQLCEFSHEDKNYSPVWKCKAIQVAPQDKNKATAAVYGQARAN